MILQDYLEKTYTKATAKAYQREIETYLKNQPQPQKATYKDILTFINSLRARYSNGRTIGRILASVKAYHEYLIYTEVREDNPARSIYLKDNKEKAIQLQDLFTSEELNTLTERKERYYALYHRNKVIITLLIHQALKPQELENLQTGDINLETGTLYIKPTPKSNARTLSLKPGQILLLHHYLTETHPKLSKNQPQTKLLLGIRGTPMSGADLSKHILRTYKNQYKNRTISIQTIRQSVITNLLKAGNDLRVVQVFAGHKYPSTTEKYKQNHIEELKQAIQKYHPMK